MYFRVNLRVHNNGVPKEVFFVAQTDHDDLAAVFDDLRRDGMIHVIRLETRQDPAAEPRARRVLDAYEMVLTRDGLTSLQEMSEGLIGADGSVLFSMAYDAPHRPTGGR